MTQTFSFSQRLHRRDEFERALQNRGLIDRWFALHSEINLVGSERLGIIVSKRVISKAVARNRLKRIIREVFRQSHSDQVSSLDIVVRIRRNLADEDAMEFRGSLFRLLMKMRMTKNDAPVSFSHKGISISD